jgi:hypothetical protein
MPKIKYRKKKFEPDSLEKIEKANVIIAEYQQQGFDLTLRQLYYQFVSRAFIENNQREYKNLGNLINDARLVVVDAEAALKDWQALTAAKVKTTDTEYEIGFKNRVAFVVESVAGVALLLERQQDPEAHRIIQENAVTGITDTWQQEVAAARDCPRVFRQRFWNEVAQFVCMCHFSAAYGDDLNPHGEHNVSLNITPHYVHRVTRLEIKCP